MKIMIQTWNITSKQNIKLDMDSSSLDEVTRQLPEGYYSTFRTFDGGTHVLGLKSHLRRLYEAVSAPEVNESFLRQQLRALLEPYRPGEARVRAVMTQEGQAYLAIAPLTLLPREIYERGVRVETTELQRHHPHLKSTSFIGRSDAERKHIAQEGIFEALLVKDGKILEGMTSNFFYVHYHRAERNEPKAKVVEVHASSSLRTAHHTCPGGRRQGSPGAFREREVVVCTASDDILFGITRETVIEIVRGRGLELKEQPLKREQLASVDEAFITSSSRGVVPVIQIDNVTIGQGSPGPITKELLTAYEAYVIQKAEKI